MDHFLPIDDGYTEDGFIAAVPGLHPELRFTYRPVRREERATWGRGLEGCNPAAQTRKTNELLAKHVASWSAVAPITAENVGRLRQTLFDKLFAVVMQERASDFDANRPAEERAADADASFRGGQ